MNNYLDVAAAANSIEEQANALKQAAITASEIEILIYNLPDEIGQEKIDEIKNTALPPLKQIQAFAQVFGRDTKGLDKVITDLENIDQSIANSENKAAEAQKKKEMIEQIDVGAIVNQGEDLINQEIAGAKGNSLKVEGIVTGDLKNRINSGLGSLSGMLGDTNTLLNTLSDTFGNLVVMFNAIDTSVDCANTSIQKTNEAIVYVNGRLIEVINKVEKASENDKLQVLLNALSGDPEVYGKFFSTSKCCYRGCLPNRKLWLCWRTILFNISILGWRINSYSHN